MLRRTFVFQLGQGFVGATACVAAGCGSLLHVERCGQPHSNQIDWKIVALDGLGLILFFIPGVVAFAVDFYTGAIYLPLHECDPGYGACPLCPPAAMPPAAMPPAAAPVYSNMARSVAAVPVVTMQQQSTARRVNFKQVVLPADQLQPQQIERAVSEHVGRPVSLDDDRVRLSRLPRIDRFGEQLDRHRSDRNFGMAIRSFFDRFKRT